MSFEDQIDEKPFNEKYLSISNIVDIEKIQHSQEGTKS